MTEKIDRRRFIQQGTAIVTGSIVAGTLDPAPAEATPPKKVDISVVQGTDYFKSTKEAVKLLGGIKRFVPPKAKVALLANPQRNNPGAFTSPRVLAAVIEMCRKAGATEVNCISWLPLENWQSTGLKSAVDEQGAKLKITDLKNEELFTPQAVAKGKQLKEARIIKSLFDHDVLINVPVCKDHAGNKFTGTLKNMMGLNSPKNNRSFHKKDWATNPDSIRFLDQCIADLNLVLKPVLNVVDATEFIITNGPFGPGKLHKPDRVIAGVDRVAIDAYCCTLWGLKAKDIHTITMAHQLGLGEIDLKKVTIREANA